MGPNTCDPAMWPDWYKAIEYTKTGGDVSEYKFPREKMRPILLDDLSAYCAMQKFLDTHYQRINKPVILSKFLNDMRLTKDKYKTINPDMWKEWHKAIEAVQKEEEDSSETSKEDE